MRIQELHLLRYGKFTDRRLELPWREQDIHLFVGANEAGKSTLRAAISDWLFGFPLRTPMAFLHPMPELRLGGCIARFPAAGIAPDRLAFERTKANKNTLRTQADAILPDATLQAWLGRLDAESFRRLYALDHALLIEGGASILAASDDLGRMLFQSAAGMAWLGQTLKTLQEEADTLWAPRKSATREYHVARDAFDLAQKEVREATLRTRDWKKQHEALAEAEVALREAQQQHAETRVRIRRLERIRRVRPLLLTLDARRGERDALLATGPLPRLPEDAGKTLAELSQSVALARAESERCQAALDEAAAALENIPLDHAVLSLAADITLQNERRLQYRAHRADILKRQEERQQEWLRVTEKAAGLGWTCASFDEIRQRIPAQSQRVRLNRLLKQRASLEARYQAAENELEKLKREIAASEAALQGMAVGSIAPALALCVDQALRAGNESDVLNALDGRLSALASALEAALSAMGRWRLSPEALAGKAFPDPDIVQNLCEAAQRDATAVQSLREMREGKQNDVDTLRLGLAQWVQNFQPVSAAEVRAARSARDACWAAIKAAPSSLPERAPGFEHEIREADALADQRLDKLQYEAERQAQTRRLESQAQELRALEARLHTLTAQIDARNAQWAALLAACDLPPLPLEIARPWLAQRDKALALWREQAELERQKQQKFALFAALRRDLWRHLEPAAAFEAAPLLDECLRLARERITLSERAAGQRKSLEARLAALQASQPTLQAALEQAEKAWKTWQLAWQDALRASACPETVLPDQLEVELEVMEEIDKRLDKIRSIQTERIDTMQADLDDLARSAHSLAARLAPDLENAEAETLLIELRERLDAAIRARNSREDWQLRVTQAKAGLATANAARTGAEARLAPLFALAGVTEVSALAEAIERSNQRRFLETAIAGAEKELQDAADGLSLDELRTEAAAQDAETLLLTLDELGQQADRLLETVAQRSQQHGGQQERLSAFSGGDQAACAEARRQAAMADMAAAVTRYLRLHSQIRLLKWAMEKFRANQQGPMLATASRLFRALTLDAFDRLLVDGEGASPRLLGVRPSGACVEVAGMSEGTRDQLYLALRLSALELQVEQGCNLPLIADDLFVNFDDARTRAGLKVLGELSRRRQIILLTHHEHLVPLARQVLGDGLNVIAL